MFQCSVTLVIKTEDSFRTSVPSYQTTRCHVPTYCYTCDQDRRFVSKLRTILPDYTVSVHTVLVSAVKMLVVSTLDTGQRSTAPPVALPTVTSPWWGWMCPREVQNVCLFSESNSDLCSGWSLPVLRQSHGHRTERLTLGVTVWSIWQGVIVWSIWQNDLTAVHSVTWLHCSSMTSKA